MRLRFEGIFVLAVCCALVTSSGGGVALAGEPAPAPPASAAPAPPASAAPAPVAAPVSAAPRGAIVVAASNEAGPAARSLAREVYRHDALRPAIDEATARALVGDAPREASSEARAGRLREIDELRASIAKAGDEVVARRLLASLGIDSGAALVVAVSVEGGRPVARVLRVSSAAYERVELGATIETSEDGTRAFQWPSAPATLQGLLPPTPVPASAAPVGQQAPLAPLASPDSTGSTPSPATKAPRAPPRPPRGPSDESKPFWRSTWFWASTGGVAAAGVTVLVLALTTGKVRTVHLDGRVLP